MAQGRLNLCHRNVISSIVNGVLQNIQDDIETVKVTVLITNVTAKNKPNLIQYLSNSLHSV